MNKVSLKIFLLKIKRFNYDKNKMMDYVMYGCGIPMCPIPPTVNPLPYLPPVKTPYMAAQLLPLIFSEK